MFAPLFCRHFRFYLWWRPRPPGNARLLCVMYILVAEASRSCAPGKFWNVRENSAVLSVEFTTLLPWQRTYILYLLLFFFPLHVS